HRWCLAASLPPAAPPCFPTRRSSDLGAAEQYGDACEVCGATYRPTDLVNPVSVLSGSKPVKRDSEHYFFKLGDFEEFLHDWTRRDRKSTRLNSSHVSNSYAVFCLKKK